MCRSILRDLTPIHADLSSKRGAAAVNAVRLLGSGMLIHLERDPGANTLPDPQALVPLFKQVATNSKYLDIARRQAEAVLAASSGAVNLFPIFAFWNLDPDGVALYAICAGDRAAQLGAEVGRFVNLRQSF